MRDSSQHTNKTCQQLVYSEASDDEFSDAHSSDFTLESDDGSDSELRGLDFNSLPTQFRVNVKNKVSRSSNTSKSSYNNYRTIKYKYPCNICDYK